MTEFPVRHFLSDDAVAHIGEGRRDWPLRFYSAERLFSVEARRNFVAPDVAALP